MSHREIPILRCFPLPFECVCQPEGREEPSPGSLAGRNGKPNLSRDGLEFCNGGGCGRAWARQKEGEYRQGEQYGANGAEHKGCFNPFTVRPKHVSLGSDGPYSLVFNGKTSFVVALT